MKPAGTRGTQSSSDCRGETNDRTDLIVVDAVDERGDQNDFNTRFVKVVDRAHLHVEQVADLTMAVRIVADSVELKIDVTQTGFSSLPAELFALGELDTIRRGLNAVVTNLARVLIASRKCGEIDGSPPENCTDIWRRGLIEMALSRISLISSMLSSWTKPTWLASMKQGRTSCCSDL